MCELAKPADNPADLAESDSLAAFGAAADCAAPAAPDASVLFSSMPSEMMRADAKARVNDIPIEIEVVIGRTKVSVAELMNVDRGHAFRLDKRFGEPVDLLVNGRIFGYGEIVTTDDDRVVGVRVLRLAG
ncbi:FliM/FliN family flagellar motor switch protein [Rhizobium sp. S152]|uniref:FliM/FliN family flagellar motor switch protein n=1 Tax=Rhizobium sp. S152 TaxID=3055038 RepID=UPI0025A9D0B2|nr:FliM/FliN family flagellar motor switch protein [Rhizobium sp. S152]MDM9629818.1 FliM/FliN family flagellar motor switch protein [Rhizobium sp. S152]